MPRILRTDQPKRCWSFTASCNFFSQISFGIACKNYSYYIPKYLFARLTGRRGGRRGVIFCHILPYQNVSFCYDKLVKLIGINSENPDGAKRTRTADPLHAMQVLYQLSYGPKSQNVFISINLKISYLTSVIPIVLYSVWLLKSAP